MPETAPNPPPATEAPPAEGDWRPGLATLRARLDGIDDQIHDLLMARAQVVEDVARSGKPAAFQPGREAAILRRLLDRHSGALPRCTLVRMWREMLAGTTAMQTQVRIAASGPSPVLEDLAREHFGFLTPVFRYASAHEALAAVRSGHATLAALPFPAGVSVWWPVLTAAAPRLHIVARLPFWADRPETVPAADVLVAAAAAPDASGLDRSFIAVNKAGQAGDFPVHVHHGTVAEVEGLVSDDDPRLAPGAIALGGYAIPVAGDKA